MSRWVNYQRLREELDFRQVLEAYGVKALYKGDQATAFCPLAGHEDKKSRSFSANLTKGIFQCFGCHTKGNVVEFAVRMEGFDPQEAEQFREGALKVQERFLGKPEGTKTAKKRRGLEEDKPEVRAASSDSAQEENVERVINAPLDFELKSIDASHAYLVERGLTSETIATFGVGYCNRGMMKGRVVIPLHDKKGELIGYAGRLVDDEVIDGEHPKYLMPGKREVKGIVHEFSKSEFLFNGHRIDELVPNLIVVEGFFQTMWLHQCGFPYVVAVMGSSLSEKQAALITRYTTHDAGVFILADGDSGGEKLAESAIQRIAADRLVRWVQLPAGNDPDTMTEEELGGMLGEAGL